MPEFSGENPNETNNTDKNKEIIEESGKLGPIKALELWVKQHDDIYGPSEALNSIVEEFKGLFSPNYWDKDIPESTLDLSFEESIAKLKESTDKLYKNRDEIYKNTNTKEDEGVKESREEKAKKYQNESISLAKYCISKAENFRELRLILGRDVAIIKRGTYIERLLLEKMIKLAETIDDFGTIGREFNFIEHDGLHAKFESRAKEKGFEVRYSLVSGGDEVYDSTKKES